MKKLTILTSLYRCGKYLEGYFYWLKQQKGISDVEVLLLHNDPQKEETEFIESQLCECPFVRHIVIPFREDLYKTWNRGVQMASGQYITNWNVDDIIFPEALQQEIRILDEHPDVYMTYGDIYYMYRYGELSDKLIKSEDFRKNKKAFFRTHQIGCFPMWRKSVHDKIGYFDEQFKIAADYDFQIRIARSFELMKTDMPVGMYLMHTPEKLSSNSSLLKTEENVVRMRYGIFDLIDYCYLAKSFNYDRCNITYLDRKIPVSRYFPQYKEFIRKRMPRIFLSVFRQPRFIAAYIKHELLKL